MRGPQWRFDRASSLPIILLLATFLTLAGAVSVVNPLFESTDEIRHYRYIRHLVVHHSLPVQGAELVRSQSHHPPLYYVLSALASGWVRSPHTPEFQQPVNPFWSYRNWEVGVDNKLQYLHTSAESFPYSEGFLAALIPRWVNVILGAVTVFLTFKLGQLVWPGRTPLALAATALVAFNPQFIYLSAAMNNDIVAAAAGAAVLLLSVDAVQSFSNTRTLLRERSDGPRGLGRRQLVRLGLTFGFALLAKFHLAIFGAIIGLALLLGVYSVVSARQSAGNEKLMGQGLARVSSVLAQLCRRQVAFAWLRALGIVMGTAGLLAGWWFVRNWWLYGDPTALNKVNELWLGRSAAGSWWALKQGLPYLWSSLWGRFGYGQIPLPGSIYTALLIFCAFALTGYALPALRAAFRAFSRQLGGQNRPQIRLNAPFLLLGLTVLGFTGVVVYYILIQPAGPMGRFLFPALPALSILLVGGLDRWPFFRERPLWTAGLVTLGMALLAVVALGGYLAPAVRYPPPASSVHLGQPFEVQFADVARLKAVEVQPVTLRPGEPLFVSAVWEPLRSTEIPYIVYIHLVDEAGVLIAQRDTWPGLGRAPTTGWRPGTQFRDTYRVDVPETAYAPNLAQVRLGLYEPVTGRLPVLNRDQEPLGDGILAGEIEVAARPGPWPNPQQTNFADEINLVGYALEPRSLAAGETFTMTLYWQTLSGRQPTHDYLVFAQVIDSDWRVWGSKDGPGPGWSPDQVIHDVRRITLLPDTPPGSYPVQVGLFHSATGRLPVLAPQGHHIDERVLLGPIRVHE